MNAVVNERELKMMGDEFVLIEEGQGAESKWIFWWIMITCDTKDLADLRSRNWYDPTEEPHSTFQN